MDFPGMKDWILASIVEAFSLRATFFCARPVSAVRVNSQIHEGAFFFHRSPARVDEERVLLCSLVSANAKYLRLVGTI